tara:strand:+ start:60 stop:611 length:552 start_codon:yes stop_codon:yes gene_type:complete
MRDKFIEVYDDIIPEHISDFIEKLVLKNGGVPLHYTHNIAKKSSNIFHPGFGDTFFHPSNNIILPYTYPFLEVLYRLGNHIDMIIEGILHCRAFVHLPSPNPGPDEVHIDTKANHYVCLYYINDSEGDTILFEDDKKTEITRVPPKKGRIVFFEGSTYHCSSRPATKTRAILNFDFIGYKYFK